MSKLSPETTDHLCYRLAYDTASIIATYYRVGDGTKRYWLDQNARNKAVVIELSQIEPSIKDKYNEGLRLQFSVRNMEIEEVHRDIGVLL